MKDDINNRTDIELLVNTFYEKLSADTQLGYVFREIAKVNWSNHLPVMCNFWENMIFYTGAYSGNPVNLHRHLHHLSPLSESHFDQWDKLFICTVDELFKGDRANLAKQHTVSISGVLRQKVLEFQSGYCFP